MREEDNYWKRAMQRRLSRRAMLRNAGLAGLGLAGATILGCNNQAQTQPTAVPTASGPVPTTKAVAGSSPVPTVIATPAAAKPTGKITISGDFHSATIDPHLNTGNTYQALGAAMFDSLVAVSVEGKTVPGIAERWGISPDGLSHTFYIRRGVKFQDGTDLTGADVKFSADRVLTDKTITGGDALLWRAAIDSVELKDAWTVVYHLKKLNFDLLPGFENFSGIAAVIPQKYFEAKGVDYFRTNPMGSGPFKFVSWDPGNRLELEAVESHWRKVPNIKNVTRVNVKEEATKVSMLKTGELDIADIAQDSAAGLKAAGLKIMNHDGGAQAFSWLFFDLANPKSSPLGDQRVRHAISLAVNRQEMADKLYAGFASPGILMFAPKSASYFDSSVLKPDPYDPDQAKKLLAEAGYSTGFKCTFWDAGGGGPISTLCQAVVGYLGKVGINAVIEPIDRAIAVQKMSNKQVPNNTMWAYTSGGGAFQFERFYTAHHSQKGSAKNHNNAQLDALIDQVPNTADPAERKKLALQACVLAFNEYVNITWLDQATIYATNARVSTFTPMKNVVPLAGVLDLIAVSK